jgi:hypothetical protein
VGEQDKTRFIGITAQQAKIVHHWVVCHEHQKTC